MPDSTFGRLRWATNSGLRRHAKTRCARLRLLWHDFIVHGVFDHGGERCQDCGRSYAAWRALDESWERVMGSSAGLLCEYCFYVRLSGAAASTREPT